MVEYKTRLYESRKGTCSYWLSTLKPDAHFKVPIWIKKGSFKIDYKKPLLCVGPGTGVAPFRSILYERIYKHNIADNHLYFGCRNRLKDYYFEKEWADTQAMHPACLHVNPAFSRDQIEKIYVQDLLLNHSSQVFELLYNKDALVLIAGNSKRMPEDVLAILEKIIATHLINNIENGEEETPENMAKCYINKLKSSLRIQLETWS